MCVGYIMKVSTIQTINSFSPIFTGHLRVQNSKTGISKEYLTNAVQDSMLRFEAKQCVPLYLGKLFKGSDKLPACASKPYLETLREVVQDDFTKELPEIKDNAYFAYAMRPEKGYVLNIFDYFKVSHSYK